MRKTLNAYSPPGSHPGKKEVDRYKDKTGGGKKSREFTSLI